MATEQALWIKDPLAILADNAERGLVVREGRIVELVAKGQQPKTDTKVFDAGRHVVLPGLINTHHHGDHTFGLWVCVPALKTRRGRERCISPHAGV